MHVLLVGGGGREHALAWKLQSSPRVRRLSFTHSNPGFPSGGRLEGDLVAAAVREGVDLVVVGPEGPLVAGLVDELARVGIPAFGPSAAAARLEGSKAYAKAFLDRHGIPTAAWSEHTSADTAHAAIQGPCVVKADGLAAGKGVVVAGSAAEAHEAVELVFGGRFGVAGARLIIEERLSGPEVSILALCDGRRAVPLLPTRDHKRRYDGDQGPNTGGMGAICPVPEVGAELLEAVRRTVLQPTVEGMAAEGSPFRGLLYAGLMLTADGPKVLEFNVRFGDPECQPLMMMLDEDLVPLLLAAASGSLPERPLRWRQGAACCVVVVGRGYPEGGASGEPIRGVPLPEADRVAFFAGVRAEGGQLLAEGGRVLGLTAWGPSPAEARARAYGLVDQIHFEGAGCRRDIGDTGDTGDTWDTGDTQEGR